MKKTRSKKSCDTVPLNKKVILNMKSDSFKNVLTLVKRRTPKGAFLYTDLYALPFMYILLASKLIKKKIKFSSYTRKLKGIGCKVIYD